MLDWISAEEGRKTTYKKLFLVWQPGYPLTVCDWVSGHGYRDIRTGLSMHPVYVAYINLPKDTGFNKA